MSQSTNSRRFNFFNLLVASNPIDATMQHRSIRLVFTQDYFLKCHNQTGSTTRNIRTVTHGLPSMINDPVLRGVTSRCHRGDIRVTLRFSSSLVNSSLYQELLCSQDYNLTIEFVRDIFREFKPYSDEDEHNLTAKKRTNIYYDVHRLIKTTKRLSDEWGFDPNPIITAYQLLPQKPVDPHSGKFCFRVNMGDQKPGPVSFKRIPTLDFSMFSPIDPSE